LSPQHESDRAVSPIIGGVLIIVITIILAMLVLLLSLGFHLPEDEIVQDIYKITYVNHYDNNGKLDFNSYISVSNTGKIGLRNRYLYAKLIVNGVPSKAKLPTLNGYAFCNSDHTGVQNIGGLGVRGNMEHSTSRWYEGQDIFIDFNDGTFRPGDTICLEIYDKTTGKIISRDTYPAPKKYTTQWFYNHFLNPQSA